MREGNCPVCNAEYGTRQGMDCPEIHESTGEERIVSNTGGAKGQKPAQLSLLPMKALMDVAKVYGYGAMKYDDVHGTRSNWRQGYDWNLSFDAAARHMTAFWDGEEDDPESGHPHLAHAIFHMLALMTFVEEYPEGDNRWSSN